MADLEAIFAKRLVTCDPTRATADDPLGVIEDAVVYLSGDVIQFVGARASAPSLDARARTRSVELLTPGLVDAHTHAVFTGSRHAEYALKLAGASYEAIAKSGGGIVSTMRAVRAASVDELTDTLVARLERMRALGVTTVEVKSGYGLDLESETKQVRAIERAAQLVAVTIVPTYLALHALPPEANGDRSAYARRVAERDVDAIAALGIAQFVDAYIDRNAFSVEEARPVLERARALGLGVRVHVGQFADVGGAELAAELGAHSADHLERISQAGAEALAKAEVCAGLLPMASFTLRDVAPPVDVLRAAGVRIVVASDSNPGTAPSESLPLAMAFAARFYGLSLSEIVLGATREAALSLGLDDRGVVAAGRRADLVGWDLPHEAALLQPWGTPRASLVVSRGAL